MTAVRMHANIRDLRPFRPGTPIEQLKRELGRDDILKLASNENPLGPSPAAVAAARRSLDMLSYYPDPRGLELKEKIAARVGVSSEQICLGNGSEDILTLAANLGSGHGDEILTTEFGFATYRVIAEKVGATPILAPMMNWGHDFAGLSARLNERTRLVFLDNPRNPTGTVVASAELIAFMRRVPERVLVVLDEAYYEYNAQEGGLDGIRLIPTFANLLVTRTFSKIHGLGGARLGYGVAHRDLIAALDRTRMPFTVNRVALAAGCAALDDDEHLARSIRVNRAGIATLEAFFDECHLPRLPAHGNFVTALLPFDADMLFERLLRHGLIVRSLATFGMPRGLRVTAGTPEQLARLLPRFREELHALMPLTRSTGLES